MSRRLLSLSDKSAQMMERQASLAQAQLADTQGQRLRCEEALAEAIDQLRQARGDRPRAEEALRRHMKDGCERLQTTEQAASATAQALVEATQARAAAASRRADLHTRMEDLGSATATNRDASMAALIAAPPGFGTPDTGGDLRRVLANLVAKLLEQSRQGALRGLAPEAILEMATRLAASCHGGDPAQAAHGLAALSGLRLEDLVARQDQRGATAAAAALASPLAWEICGLPRGVDILAALAQPSQPALTGEQRTSVQVYLRAGAELARHNDAELGDAARDWLLLAQAEAAARVHRTGDRSASHRQTVAFQGVRNGLLSVGAGSAYERVDRYMRSIAGTMLEHAVQAGGRSLARSLASRVVPLGSPTPFNQPALTAAGKAAGAVGIVDRVPQAMKEVAAAAVALQDTLEEPSADWTGILRGLAEAARHAAAPAASGLRAEWFSAVRTLLKGIVLPDEARTAAERLERALNRAAAAQIMADPRIGSVEDAAGFFNTLLTNFQLRDKLKMTGGNIKGLTTAGLAATENFIPGAALQGRVDLRYARQQDEVLELFLAPQAIQLTLGEQATTIARGGVGLGVGIGLPSLGMLLARPVDAEWRVTREVQAQTGVLLRLPRTNATEAADLIDFKAAVADIVNWQALKLPDGRPYEGPLEMVLARHPRLSVNLLGDYDRRAVRRETGLQAGAAVRLPGLALSAGAWLGSRNQAMVTRASEDTGYFQFQEKKQNVQVVRLRGAGAGAGVPLLSSVRGPAGVAAGGLRLQVQQDTRTKGIEKVFRLTTIDGVLEPNMCRYTSEYAGLEEFLKDVRAHWRGWVARGVQYAAYPAEWPEHAKQQDAERELETFLAEVQAKHNEFMVMQVVHAIHAEVAPQVDTLRGLVETARRCGDKAELAHREAMLDTLLADPNTWMIGRLVATERSNCTEQTGLALGVVAQSSSVADASHAVLTYPAHPRV